MRDLLRRRPMARKTSMVAVACLSLPGDLQFQYLRAPSAEKESVTWIGRGPRGQHRLVTDSRGFPTHLRQAGWACGLLESAARFAAWRAPLRAHVGRTLRIAERPTMSNQPMPQTTKSPKAPVVPPPPSPTQKTPTSGPLPRHDTVRPPFSSEVQKREEDRDEVLRESFPASDPPPVSPGPGE